MRRRVALATAIAALALGTPAHAAPFRTGVTESWLGPPPTNVPAAVVRVPVFASSDIPNRISYTQALNANGKLALVNADWHLADTDWQTLTDNAASTWFEIGNEAPGADYAAYFARLPQIASIVHENPGDLTVLMPETTRRELDFLRAVPNSMWQDGTIDRVALHPYAPTPQGALQEVQDARALVPKRIPFFVTEVGWSVRADVGPTTLVVSEAQQAQNLTDVFDLFYQNARPLRLQLVTWYNYSDFYGDGSWDDFCGLVRNDGTHRPSYDALAAIPPKR